MTRTLLPEAAVGSMALVVVLYLLPVVTNANMVGAGEVTIQLVIAILTLTLGAYILIATYCFATMLEQFMIILHDSVRAYIAKRRREYL